MAIRVIAQEYPRGEMDISRIADEIYGQPDGDLDYEALHENLIQLVAHPVDLNKAAAEDFTFLNILSAAQIKSLIDYRTAHGDFITLYELQAVPALDLTTIYKLVPFIAIKEKHRPFSGSTLKRIRDEGETYFLLRYERSLQQKNGFLPGLDDDSRFRGSPDKLYARFRSSKPGDFSFGFTAEKDPGEPIKWQPSTRYYGMDYVSFHIQLQNKGRIKNLILGDFQNQFGQGLMFGGIFGMGKGSETITTVRRSNIGMLPYTSLYEAGAMRGIGLTFQPHEHFLITAFVSKFLKDGTIVSGDSRNVISSFQTTGFHRNARELSTRKAITEKNFGGVIQYQRNGLDAGLMFSSIDFGVPVERKTTAYNQFMLTGSLSSNVGIYVNYNVQNLTCYTELDRSLKGGYAWVAGFILSVSPKFDVSFLYRRYDPNFYSFYTGGFAESSGTQNERGLYWGWKYTFNRRYSIAGYVDVFKFPWLRFRNYAPSTGHEWLLRFNYEPSRKTKIVIQVREESKTRNIELDSIKQYRTAPGKKTNYLASVDYSPHTMLRLKSRVQLSSYGINGSTTYGSALMQDLILDIGKLKCTLRYALFETDDYDNRQYAYENDVWLAYSLPAYYGAGVRRMAIIEYKINKQFSVWIRYGQTRYRNQEYVGDGVDQINGNSKDDIKAQVVVKF
jgi:hypothetical protein